MTKDIPGEVWKNVQFNLEFSNPFRLEVSNLGRLRTFNKASDGNIIKGGLVEGYRIVRLRLYKPREEKTQIMLDGLRKKVENLTKKLRTQIKQEERKSLIDKTKKELKALKKSVSKKFQSELNSRGMNYQALAHRLVAEYFLPKPRKEQTLVAHLDYDKLNNRATNLKWMTPHENYEHQKGSPYVIEEKRLRQNGRDGKPHGAKLTVTKVMLLKKLLNEGKSMHQLVKFFKITDTQILRIKRGENWGNIPPAQ